MDYIFIMRKNITLSISMNSQLASRISAMVDKLEDPYGKKNRSYTLRRLVEAGLEKLEAEISDRTR
jgi:hypothetical protein